MPPARPTLTIGRILAWADAHRRRTGRWPQIDSGRVVGARGERWSAINDALFRGGRGLPGGSSIARLLARRRGRVHKHEGRRLTEKQILAWADAHRRRTGAWPNRESGAVVGGRGDTWSAVEDALKRGGRGLPAGSSLPKLLAARRGRRHVRYQPPLPVERILAWADAHHRRTGQWPTAESGAVPGEPDERWHSIDAALVHGRRGLRGRTTLVRFLARHRGRRYQAKGPPLTEGRIVAWARAHHRRTSRWPDRRCGRVVGGPPGETWQKIDGALMTGNRGLQGGSTLLKLLAKRCGVHHPHFRPQLPIQQILRWADAHRRRTGAWPMPNSGPVHGAPQENWSAVNAALYCGRRGLRPGSSLPRLLARHRGRRHKHEPPRLTLRKIMAWADAHYERTGDWPSRHSGPVQDEPGEFWSGVNAALAKGTRGLRGGSSLVRLLAARRRVLYRRKGLPLRREQILGWAAAHHELTGTLPTKRSGEVRGVQGEFWAAIDASLKTGSRGLPGRSSLSELLATHYERPYPGIGRRLSEKRIVEWARSFRRRTGRWPTRRSAYVDTSRTEQWRTIDLALREGHRGLAGGSSLARLLAAHRRRES